MRNRTVQFTRIKILGLGVCLIAYACTPSGHQPPKKQSVEAPAASTTVDRSTARRSKTQVPDDLYLVNQIEVGRYGGTLVLGTAGDPKSFNPLIANESSSNVVLRLMFSFCWAFHNGRQIDEPGLCKSYSRSDDGLVYTFTLRDGLRWSDGTALTADDFEFSYRVLLDDKVPNTDRDLFRQGVDRSGRPIYPTFERVDSKTFRFVLKRPDVLFHYVAGSYPVMPQHRWKSTFEAGGFTQAMGTKMAMKDMIGSGPFIVSAYEPGQRVVLNRNPHYWKVDTAGQRLPYLDKVELLILPDEQAKLALFESGETHLHDVLPSEYARLKRLERKGDYRIVDLGPSFNTNYLMFNLDPRSNADGTPRVDPVRLKWFKKKGFRAAISHAIDRESIVRNVLFGRGQPLWSYVSPANRRWYPKTVKRYPFDLQQSAMLLKAEGFRQKDGLLVDKNGVPVQFTILTNAENGMRISMLNYIKQDLAQLGIKVDIRPLSFNDVVTALRDTRRFEAVLLGWGVSVPPDPGFSKNVLMSRGRSHNWYPEQAKPATPWEGEI
ncbi:MAG: ABC transporter substrate-binding protein, partial [Myxococcota bacterium]|nr:ABC transporter substrate-binding protein [Myxococcota bacterium]